MIGDKKLKIDVALLICYIVLTCIGILTIYSANSGSIDSVQKNQYVRQIYWAITAFVIFVVVLFVNYQRLGEYALFIYLGGILLLVLTLLIGTRVRGARSWITIFSGVGFQPSEFVKIAVIIALARFLEQVGEDIRDLKNVLLTLLIGLFPAGLILIQPDFGTALVYIPISLIMLFFAGIRYMHLFSLVIILGMAVIIPLISTFSALIDSQKFAFLQVLDNTKTMLFIALLFAFLSMIMFAVFKLTKKNLILKASHVFLIFLAGLLLAIPLGRFLKPYQKERLIVFLKPSIDPFGSGYNIIQSKIAVGAGGMVGSGLLGGSQSQLGFLPERSTDFIFAIFAEEWGFLGSLALLVVYGLFLYRGVMIIFNARDRFSLLLASGLVGMFLFHIIINIGMTIGVMPITGIPLPFLSYGGTFLIASSFGAALLMNIEMRRQMR